MLPDLEDLFDQLQGAHVFSKIDIQFGYCQLKIRTKELSKTSFRTRYSHNVFLVVHFGPINAPTIFMELMNPVLHTFLDTFVVVFTNDILIQNCFGAAPFVFVVKPTSNKELPHH